jgi:hypothetical protein
MMTINSLFARAFGQHDEYDDNDDDDHDDDDDDDDVDKPVWPTWVVSALFRLGCDMIYSYICVFE